MTALLPAEVPGTVVAVRTPRRGETDPVVWAAAVRALPALGSPPDGRGPADPKVRYHPRALTAAWLDEIRSQHTRRAYFRDLAHYLAWCVSRGLDPLAPPRAVDIGVYRAGLQQGAKQLADSSVRRRLAGVSSWYGYLVANGASDYNPVSGVRRPPAPRGQSSTASPTEDQTTALLAVADRLAQDAVTALRAGDPLTPGQVVTLRHRAVLRVMSTMGNRVGEIVSLDVKSQSHNQGRRTLRYVAKGGLRRERSVDGWVWQAVDEYLAARAAAAGMPVGQLDGPLFATRSGQRLDEPAVRKLIRRVARLAGLPNADRLSPHSLRHQFFTVTEQHGVPLERRQRAGGHADPRTTMGYSHTGEDLHAEPGLVLGQVYAARTAASATHLPR